MGANTAITWAHHTWNPWTGCQKVSPGCDHCYAEGWSKRSGHVVWGPGAQRRRTGKDHWALPRKWNAAARDAGEPARVFCASLADWLDNAVPTAWRADMLERVRTTPHLDWLLLSKRIGNWRQLLEEAHNLVLATWPAADAAPLAQWIQAWLQGAAPSNVWIGSTVVDQAEADRDIPKLLRVPAVVRFLSIEPMLGPIDLTAHLWGKATPCADCPKDADCHCGYNPRAALELMDGEPALHWVIVGAESGTGARPAVVQWFHALVAQCAAADVAVHVKQLGKNVLDFGHASPGQHWPRGIERENYPRRTNDDPGFLVRLQDIKGSDPAEWPEALRVRQLPASSGAAVRA